MILVLRANSLASLMNETGVLHYVRKTTDIGTYEAQLIEPLVYSLIDVKSRTSLIAVKADAH